MTAELGMEEECGRRRGGGNIGLGKYGFNPTGNYIISITKMDCVQQARAMHSKSMYVCRVECSGEHPFATRLPYPPTRRTAGQARAGETAACACDAARKGGRRGGRKKKKKGPNLGSGL